MRSIIYLKKDNSKISYICPKTFFCKKRFIIDVLDRVWNMFLRAELSLKKGKTKLSYKKRKATLSFNPILQEGG